MHQKRILSSAVLFGSLLLLSGCWWPPSGSDPSGTPIEGGATTGGDGAGTPAPTTGAGGSHCGPGDGATGGSESSGRPQVPPPGVVSGGPGAGGTGGGDSRPGTGSGGQNPAVPVPLVPVLAMGVELDAVVLNQGVRHTLMQAGSEVDDALPVVAGRDALLRVFYSSNAGYDGKEVEARLFVGEHQLRQMLVLNGTSTDADLGSTINFDVPGEWLEPGVDYRVTLTQLAPLGSTGNPRAAHPAKEQISLAVEDASTALEVVLVPVLYHADGSGRAPVLDEAQRQLYLDAIYSHFPTESVAVSVRAPYDFSQQLNAKGAGWSQLLAAVADLRFQDNAPPNRYYFGVVAPAASFSSFCAGGCVTGLGYLTPEGNNWARAAIGLGFRGERFAETAVHELGHNHGREHAPCGGPANVDASFPHSGGLAGAWGYNLLTKELQTPSKADFMGYCDPAWVSDYTYEALYQRLRSVAQEALPVGKAKTQEVAQVFDRVAVDARGSARWLAPVTLRRAPQGSLASLRRRAASGAAEASSGVLIQHDHLPGGVVFVARQHNSPSAVRGFEILNQGTWRRVLGQRQLKPLGLRL